MRLLCGSIPHVTADKFLGYYGQEPRSLPLNSATSR
jgi:hypothetical protein